MEDRPRCPGLRGELLALAALFLRLGVTAFGGPAAHIAMMRDEVVTRRGWMSDERLLDLIAATNLIPGPSSTELAIHIGLERAGWRGLLVAGASFILPATAIVGALAFLYVRYGTLPEAEAALYGVKPVIIAVIVQALAQLGPRALKDPMLTLLGVLALVASALGVSELLVLLGAGVLALALRGRPRAAGTAVIGAVPLLKAGTAAAATATTGGALAASAGGALASSMAGASAVSLASLFGVFAKIGSVLFGSGYVLLAFLRTDLVVARQWLTEAQLIDAVAIGQVTPGPVFTTATFIGYVLAGPSGAAVATLGIFAPAFVFVAISGPLIPRMRRSPAAGAFLDGVTVASLALMALVTVQLARASLIDPWTVALAAAAALLLIRFRLNSTWLVLGGAASGMLIHAL